MSCQRGTPHCGSSGHGQAQHDTNLRPKEGYNYIGVSIPVRTLIDEWEAHLVIEHLARGIGGRHINHYWLIKNMMGSLMEEMVNNWNYTRSSVLSVKTKWIELDTQLNRMDVASS